jgi:hypothetical protein
MIVKKQIKAESNRLIGLFDSLTYQTIKWYLKSSNYSIVYANTNNIRWN